MGRGYFCYPHLSDDFSGTGIKKSSRAFAQAWGSYRDTSQISYPGNKKGPAIGVDRGAASFLVAVWAVGAAAAGGAGAGAAASLGGVVEAAALKFNTAGRERLGGRSAAVGAHALGGR